MFAVKQNRRRWLLERAAMSLTIKSSAIGFGLGELALGQTFDVLEYRLVTPRYALVSINRLLLRQPRSTSLNGKAKTQRRSLSFPEPSLGIVRKDVSPRSCSCLPIYMLSLKSSSQSRCRTPRLRRFASPFWALSRVTFDYPLSPNGSPCASEGRS